MLQTSQVKNLVWCCNKNFVPVSQSISPIVFLLTHSCQIKAHSALHGNIKPLLGLAHRYHKAHAMLILEIPQWWVHLGSNIIMTSLSIGLCGNNVSHIFMVTK